MELTHSMIKKHRGKRGRAVLLQAISEVNSIDSFCNKIEEFRKDGTFVPSYHSCVESAPNLWAGDMLEVLMEAWFQYSNTINTFHVAKPNEVWHPMLVRNYRIVDRDGDTTEEDHGVDAYADTDVEDGLTIQIKYRQKRNNLTRNQLATFIIESQNPRYNASNGRRLVITTGEGEGGMGKGIISNITKYYGFDNIHYVNRSLLRDHMDGTSFWNEFRDAVESALAC